MPLATKRPNSGWICLVMLAAATSSALAGDPQPRRTLEPTVTVHFSDLNTSTVTGSRILYGRISAAAMAVCSRGGAWYPTQVWARQDCYRATVERVIAKLNLPLLTALQPRDSARTPDAAAPGK